MIRILAAAMLFALWNQPSIASEQPAKPAAERQPQISTDAVLPAIPPNPVDVNVLSAPPTQVNVSNWPALAVSDKDVAKGTWQLVGATWVLGIATFAAVVVALVVAGRQSRETKRRDRAMMIRELNRVAHQVISTAAAVREKAEAYFHSADSLWKAAGHPDGLPEANKKKAEGPLAKQKAEIDEAAREANSVVVNKGNMADSMNKLDDTQLADKLLRLDAYQVLLGGFSEMMRADLDELAREVALQRQRRADIQNGIDRMLDKR